MSSVIPQMVNIKHALDSEMVQKIRKDIKDFTDAPELSMAQIDAIHNYIESLEVAFSRFTKDNEHVEKKENGVTDADVQLYAGLKAMYTDYLQKLITIKKDKATRMDQVSKDDPKEYLSNEMPYLQPTDRLSYVTQLNSNKSLEQLLPNKSPELVDSIVNLCILDSSVEKNLRSYIELAQNLGLVEDLAEKLPQELLYLVTDLVKKPAVLNDDSKKKISISKYLKKGDTNIVTSSDQKKRSLPDEAKSQTTKKLKSNGSVVIPILKTESVGKKPRSSRNKIKFVDDRKLVTVYGDGLPIKGVRTSPDELKKILKPFKDGQPREVYVLKGFNSRPLPLSIVLSDKREDISDISELKGGVVPTMTNVLPVLRSNFKNFSRDLDKSPREPVNVDKPIENLKNSMNLNSKTPMIARAFGKNNLLLRKDRGGLPYKKVPEVVPNRYPPRPLT